MSEMKHDGGPAFPPAYEPDPNDYTKAVYRGLTKRDWFAGQAITAIGGSIQAPSGADLYAVCAEIARVSYMVADAMLAARTESLPLSKGQEEGNG